MNNSYNSSGSKVTRLCTGRPENCCLIPGTERTFLFFFTVSSLPLGLTHSSVYLVEGESVPPNNIQGIHTNKIWMRKWKIIKDF